MFDIISFSLVHVCTALVATITYDIKVHMKSSQNSVLLTMIYSGVVHILAGFESNRLYAGFIYKTPHCSS